jgi:uncharacterized phage protein (TIGR01671 family)
MREIKFRAWDKWNNEMIQPHEGDFIKWHSMSNWKECLEVMQYTGLKDKNGQEIYEGDILKRLNSRLEGTYTVVWEDNGFKIEYKFMRNYEGEEYEDKNFIPIYSDSYEVIGNIYEGVKGK